MANITLHSDSSQAVTSVSNIFIDEYMSDANGEFVKIYLYLLRQLSAPDTAFSISSLADKFEHTEKDIKRALAYWEKMQLLHLEYDAENNLTGIRFLDTRSRSTTVFSSSEPSDTVSETTAVTPVTAASTDETAAEPSKKAYSADDIKNFREDEAVAELLFISERYLGRVLTATDVNSILYWYDGLGFSPELIEYLVEYCVSKGHTSIRYIEKVALAWAKDQIKTIEQAKLAAGLNSQLYFSVVKALGISGRNLVPSETAFIEKWNSEYGFSAELISEACQRTIQTIHQPSFEYTDSILTNWKNKNVACLEDITRLDAAFQTKKKSSVVITQQTSSKNKFNNFEQRSYDYDKLEKMLLTTSVH